MPGADERFIEEGVKGESFACQCAAVACVGGQDSVCVGVEERLASEDAPRVIPLSSVDTARLLFQQT